MVDGESGTGERERERERRWGVRLRRQILMYCSLVLIVRERDKGEEA